MKKVILADIINESKGGTGVEVEGSIFKAGSVVTNMPFQVMAYSNPLQLDASVYKDFICEEVTGDCVINLNNTSDGDAGLIEIIMENSSNEYSVTLGSMFTKDVGGNPLVTTAAADNFIGWRNAGGVIVYSISQVQA